MGGQTGSNSFVKCAECGEKLFSKPARCPFCGRLLWQESLDSSVADTSVDSVDRADAAEASLSNNTFARGIVGAVIGLAGVVFFLIFGMNVISFDDFSDTDSLDAIRFLVLCSALPGIVLGAIGGIMGAKSTRHNIISGPCRNGGWDTVALGGFLGSLAAAFIGVLGFFLRSLTMVVIESW